MYICKHIEVEKEKLNVNADRSLNVICTFKATVLLFIMFSISNCHYERYHFHIKLIC